MTKASPPEDGMKAIQNLGFKTVAMALRDDSYSIDDPELLAEEKLAVILGTEGDGLASQTIADCDYTVMIPMSHGVDSFECSSCKCCSILGTWAQEIRQKWRGK